MVGFHSTLDVFWWGAMGKGGEVGMVRGCVKLCVEKHVGSVCCLSVTVLSPPWARASFIGE